MDAHKTCRHFNGRNVYFQGGLLVGRLASARFSTARDRRARWLIGLISSVLYTLSRLGAMLPAGCEMCAAKTRRSFTPPPAKAEAYQLSAAATFIPSTLLYSTGIYIYHRLHFGTCDTPKTNFRLGKWAFTWKRYYVWDSVRPFQPTRRGFTSVTLTILSTKMSASQCVLYVCWGGHFMQAVSNKQKLSRWNQEFWALSESEFNYGGITLQITGNVYKNYWHFTNYKMYKANADEDER